MTDLRSVLTGEWLCSARRSPDDAVRPLWPGRSLWRTCVVTVASCWFLYAMLRAHGTPARARCGFGGYFGTGAFEDHWVCEYWDAAQRRWRLYDAQIDDTQLGWFSIGFDLDGLPVVAAGGRSGSSTAPLII